MNYTDNYELKLPESSDIVNPLINDNQNYIKIDQQMKDNADASVSTATELKSGTIHALTRDNEDASVFRFTATSNYDAGDTFTVDGVPVTALLPNGASLGQSAFVIGGTVLCSLVGTLLTVYTYKNEPITPSIIENTIFPTIADLIYPVGSIYMSTNSTSPATLFGGTWTQIKDSFLLACGDTYANGTTGGSASVSLTEAQLPQHRHTIPALSGTAASAGSHSHQILLSDTGGAGWDFTYGNSPSYSCRIQGSSGSAGAHTHSVTTTASNTGYIGSGNGHNNMPPYLAVYCWRRTA